MRHVSFTVLLLLALVALSKGKACDKHSECDMNAGEWCGSGCGEGDNCCPGPCQISESKAHSCLSCAERAIMGGYTITDDCFCLTDDAAELGKYDGRCYDDMGRPNDEDRDQDHSEDDIKTAEDMCGMIARGGFEEFYCEHWERLSSCESSWMDTCGFDHPSGPQYNDVPMRDGGVCPRLCPKMSSSDVTSAVDMCQAIAAGGVSDLCETWMKFSNCDDSWMDTCGFDHPSGSQYNHNSMSDGGACGCSQGGYDIVSCAEACSDAPTTCDSMLAMLGTGGCANICTPEERFVLAIEVKDIFDNEKGCSDRFVKEAIGEENLEWLTDDVVWKNWLSGRYNADVWPACTEDCAAAPTSCEDGFRMAAEGGCATDCTESETQQMIAMMIGLKVYNFECLRVLTPTSAPTSAPTSPPTSETEVAPAPRAATNDTSTSQAITVNALLATSLAMGLLVFTMLP
eukprot:CAMPEP_0197844046 /NCGR_PEP_ID=MMETSP1438-20131217/1015_1 /TAXON_ID=1461541 /ORGANISM="Pterosperma sp., Strain CCMP1384" /LENGTH=456 /DNA_ID=CAMNT_0043454591 /DNA_START=177 /DNA_END=1547 /DNA_ORIENTATION=-